MHPLDPLLIYHLSHGPLHKPTHCLILLISGQILTFSDLFLPCLLIGLLLHDLKNDIVCIEFTFLVKRYKASLVASLFVSRDHLGPRVAFQ